MPTLTRRGAAAAVAALATVLAAACAPGSSGDEPESKAPAAVNTDVAKAGNVTLTVWDQEVQGGQKKQIEELNKRFQAKYPNVKINRVSRSFSDLQKTLRLALSGSNPPDVVEANQGYGSMAQYVKAGMLLPLDSYDQVYGWRKRYPKGLTDLNSVTKDGKLIGSGNLYGVSLNGEIVGLYYNKEKLAKLGVQPPKTWAEFDQALATAKGKGEVPIAFGNLEKLPAMQLYGILQDGATDKEAVRKLVFGSGGSWTDAPNVQAAQKLADWSKKGYLTKDANAVKWDDTPVNFAKGDGVFMFGGTWWASELNDKMKDKVGFMLPPAAQAGAPTATMGGESLPWSITAKSKHPDVAAAYINFITSPEAMDVSVETGNLPALAAPSKQPAEPLLKDVSTAWAELSKNDGITPYIDYATPTFADAFGGPLQELVAGRKPADEVMKAAQDDYSAFQKKK